MSGVVEGTPSPPDTPVIGWTTDVVGSSLPVAPVRLTMSSHVAAQILEEVEGTGNLPDDGLERRSQSATEVAKELRGRKLSPVVAEMDTGVTGAAEASGLGNGLTVEVANHELREDQDTQPARSTAAGAEHFAMPGMTCSEEEATENGIADETKLDAHDQRMDDRNANSISETARESKSVEEELMGAPPPPLRVRRLDTEATVGTKPPAAASRTGPSAEPTMDGGIGGSQGETHRVGAPFLEERETPHGANVLAASDKTRGPKISSGSSALRKDASFVEEGERDDTEKSRRPRESKGGQRESAEGESDTGNNASSGVAHVGDEKEGTSRKNRELSPAVVRNANVDPEEQRESAVLLNDTLLERDMETLPHSPLKIAQSELPTDPQPARATSSRPVRRRTASKRVSLMIEEAAPLIAKKPKKPKKSLSKKLGKADLTWNKKELPTRKRARSIVEADFDSSEGEGIMAGGEPSNYDSMSTSTSPRLRVQTRPHSRQRKSDGRVEETKPNGKDAKKLKRAKGTLTTEALTKGEIVKSSAKNRDDAVFKGFAVAFTMNEGDGARSRLKKRLIDLVVPNGGRVIETVAEFAPALDDVEDGESVVVLVASVPTRTEKFLHALAAGIPIVELDWIVACIEAKQLVDPRSYLVLAGSARTAQAPVKQLGLGLMDSDPYIIHVQPAKRVFAGKIVYLRVRTSADKERSESILSTAGALVVTRPPLICTPKEPLYVLTDRPPPPSFRRQMNRAQLICVTWEWLVECLICGYFIQPHKHASFQP